MREDAEMSLPEGAQAGDGARSHRLLVEFLLPSGPHINMDDQFQAVCLFFAIIFFIIFSLKPTNDILGPGLRTVFYTIRYRSIELSLSGIQVN